MYDFLTDKVILVTGATGYFGRHYLKHLLEFAHLRKVISYSRDEHKQDELEKDIHHSVLRIFIGDIRDERRLMMAMNGVDYVVHAAALKRVPRLEYNPFEAVRTNIIGTMHVINCCVKQQAKGIYLSTDKAVMPINLYGGTKMVAEKLWIDANFYRPGFSVVRYGNVMGSRGSVLNIYRELAEKKAKKYPVTEPRCSRFWVDIADAVKLVMQTIEMEPGVVVVPKVPSFNIVDLAKAFYQRAEIEEIGLRPGEKIHEFLISEHEMDRAYEFTNYYKILPERVFDEAQKYYISGGKKITEPIVSNSNLMSQAEIRSRL